MQFVTPQKLPRDRRKRHQAQEITASCVVCLTLFSYVREGTGRFRRFCSEECKVQRSRRARKPQDCATCRQPFYPRHGRKRRKYCSNECHLAAYNASRPRLYESEKAAKRAQSHRRRARLRCVEAEVFDDIEIFQRDGWRCGLCSKKVDKRLKYPHPMSASLDHIVPLADGGTHTRLNTQCSHWICNSRKTHLGGGQLRLFG